jgi:hypothetical protein
VPTVHILGSCGFDDVAPPWGLFEAPVPSRAFRLGEGSFAGPYNTALEPARPTVGCYSVAVARGSARAVIRTANEESQILFHPGRCSFLVLAGAPCCFTRLGRIALLGLRSHSDLGRGTDEEQEHLAAATIGVVRGESAYSSRRRAGARAAARECAWFNPVGSRIDPPSEGQPSPVVAPSVRATVAVLGSSRLRRRRAALGAVRGVGHRAPFDFARAHSRGRITSRWSRRARPSGAILSPRRAAQREPLARRTITRSREYR